LKLQEKIETKRDDKLQKKLDKLLTSKEYRLKMETFLALFDNKIKQRNRRIQEWSEAMQEQRNFELKMVTFLALLDHKINNRVFRRSRSAARTLAKVRQDEVSNRESKVQIPEQSMVYPYQQEFHHAAEMPIEEEEYYEEDSYYEEEEQPKEMMIKPIKVQSLASAGESREQEDYVD
jgi:hypothetical protein